MKKKPEVKKLTPEEQRLLEKRRQTFRELHNSFTETPIDDADEQLRLALEAITVDFSKIQDTLTVKKLGTRTKNEKIDLILDILKNQTLSEASAYINAMINAITQHKFLKTKDLTVKELEIKLL